MCTKNKKNGDTSIMITVPPTNLKAKTQTENQWMQMQCVQQKSLHHETAFKQVDVIIIALTNY